MSGLPIREVAEKTGLAAGTIRMWEQRYGFPTPERTPGGYRVYSVDDVDLLRRVVELRRTGLSVPAALERARGAAPAPEHPSIFGSVAKGGGPRLLRKRTMIALSRAIEDESLASAARPVVFGAFQRPRFYRLVQHRWRRLAGSADFAAVFAEFDELAEPEGAPVEVPIGGGPSIAHEWAVVVDAPAFCALLTAWEPPPGKPPASDRDRVFEAYWTLDPVTVRQASRAACAIAREHAPRVAERIDAVLSDRPLGAEVSVAALEALTGRMIGYLEGV